MAAPFAFGWQPDLPDHRDLVYSVPLPTVRKLPPSIDLRRHCPPVYDQGHLGSCTANAIAGAIHFDRRKAKEKPDFVPSRLFIYFNERDMEHDVAYDAGARIRDGVKSVNKLGVPPESEWPYDQTGYPTTDGAPFAPGAPAATRPPKKVYADAGAHKAITYLSVNQTLPQLKGCLADGFPFIFGFTVYENFFGPDGTPETHTPMPSGSVLGGHAVLAVGYDDAAGHFVVRNSWGTKVLDKGYYYMPYAYVSEPTLASDFWTIRSVAH
jgi:C1A family cysteine protease